MRDFGENAIFKKAIAGSGFGLVNILLVFIPFLYSIFENKALFILHIVAALIMSGLFISVILIYKGSRNYTFGKIRYLYFVGFFSGTALLGISLRYILLFGFKFSNLYFFILQALLILMSAIDIITPAHNGMIRMRSLYLRTIGGHYFNNIITITAALVLGIFLALSVYVI
ncbi:MAG: hypothetical protein E7411_08345 [Ruminococcaceae bacterium]|nr:hypothetical protein [Oscillospiraceae bacterium]